MNVELRNNDDLAAARDIHLTLRGRSGVSRAIAEPNRDEALIGAIVLGDLDLLADPVDGTCHPRDSEEMIAEIG